MKALIIDDSNAIFLVMKDILEKYNIECEHASESESGVDKIREKEFDLIFVDWNMPHFTGEEIIKFVFENNLIDSISNIIPMFIEINETDLSEIEYYGCHKYLVKPITTNSFEHILELEKKSA